MTTPTLPKIPPLPERPPEAYRTWALVSLLRLRWFIHLRWAFVIAAYGALGLQRLLVPRGTHPGELLVVVGAVAFINAIWTAASWRLHKRFEETAVAEKEAVRTAQVFANAQVAADLFLLTLILRFTGGVENPMAVFYVFHIAISALLLTPWQAALQALWAVLLFSAMAVGELFGVLKPHYCLLPWHESPGWYADWHYVVVVIGVQAVGIFGVLYFTLQIALRLDKRDRQLLAANEALRKSQIAIQDLQIRRSRFMQTAAHQLKSPLAVIQTLAALIRDEIVPPEAVRPTTEKIIQRCQEGIAQVTELLTLARVQEADPQRHRQVLTDIGQVTRELCRKYRAMAESKQLTFTCRIPENRDLRAHVDPRDAADCIGNLIENAIKYTPGPGQVHVKVTYLTPEQVEHSKEIRLRGDEDGYVFVAVKDTGIGIDPKALGDDSGEKATIFDAFRRANNALAAGIPGTGLGLSIVREVIEQAGGKITVHSKLGEGSTFVAMFPVFRHPEALSVRDTRSSRVVLEESQPEAETLAKQAASPGAPAEPQPES